MANYMKLICVFIFVIQQTTCTFPFRSLFVPRVIIERPPIDQYLAPPTRLENYYGLYAQNPEEVPLTGTKPPAIANTFNDYFEKTLVPQLDHAGEMMEKTQQYYQERLHAIQEETRRNMENARIFFLRTFFDFPRPIDYPERPYYALQPDNSENGSSKKIPTKNEEDNKIDETGSPFNSPFLVEADDPKDNIDNSTHLKDMKAENLNNTHLVLPLDTKVESLNDTHVLLPIDDEVAIVLPADETVDVSSNSETSTDNKAYQNKDDKQTSFSSSEEVDPRQHEADYQELPMYSRTK